MKKYAVITGASSGIGKEFARKLAGEGYPLILTARRAERLEKIADEFDSECLIIAADLSREEECLRFFNEIKDKNIDVFINNAGFGLYGAFAESDIATELSMIDVNIRAVHLLTKLMLEKMRSVDSGYILNVASCAGLMPAGPFMATYYATKAYVASLSQAVAEELREQKSNVYVGCLCPGPVNTEFNKVANVKFALKGISPDRCAEYALAQMRKRKEVIIPSFLVKCGMTFGRFLPRKTYVKISAHQQKKKSN